MSTMIAVFVREEEIKVTVYGYSRKPGEPADNCLNLGGREFDISIHHVNAGQLRLLAHRICDHADRIDREDAALNVPADDGEFPFAPVADAGKTEPAAAARVSSNGVYTGPMPTSWHRWRDLTHHQRQEVAATLGDKLNADDDAAHYGEAGGTWHVIPGKP